MKAKYLLVSLLLSAGLLIGCNGGNNNSENEELQYTQEEARANAKKLAQEHGFEVTIHVEASDTDEGEDVNQDIRFGYTSDVFWIHETGAYKKVEGGVAVYSYNDETHQYEGYGMPVPGIEYDEMFEMQSTFLFNAYEYKDVGFNFNNKKSVTFLGRAATEYNAAYAGTGGAASFTVVVDNETGMTLKVAASATSTEGESGAASFEVTMLNIDVQPPVLIDTSLNV